MWTIWAERIVIGQKEQEAKKNRTLQLKSIWKSANTFLVMEPVSIT